MLVMFLREFETDLMSSKPLNAHALSRCSMALVTLGAAKHPEVFMERMSIFDFSENFG